MKKQDELIFFGDYFEWQSSKAKANIVNHEVNFAEAAEVFYWMKPSITRMICILLTSEDFSQSVTPPRESC